MFRKLMLVALCLGCAACGSKAGPSGVHPAAGPASAASPADPAAFQQEQLSKLAEAPVPAGVDPALWKVLTKHFAALLAAGKVVRSAPSSAGSSARLELDPLTHQLSWGYSALGDCDQNGEVNLGDLQPLSVHFGQSTGGGAFPVAGVQSVVDGDSNGEINLADLQPIAANFGRSVTQFNIYSSTSFADFPATPTAPNGAGAVLVGSVLQSAGTGVANQSRVQYSYNLPAFAPATFYWLRLSDGTTDGTASNSVSGGAGGNVAPVAAFVAAPGSGESPLSVSFNAGVSSDPDGAHGDITDILQFQWDFDGDGSFDQTLLTPTVDHVYSAPGTYHARLRVTDAGGAVTTSASAMITVTVNGNLPPAASLVPDKTWGHAAVEVLFDASATTDDAGTGALVYDWDFDGNGTYDLNTGNIPAASHLYSAPGSFQAKVRVTDAGSLSATATVQITVASALDNLPPIATFTAKPAGGTIPFTPTFRFNGCNDPDGHIVLYEFDYQGDGTYDVSSSTAPASLQFQYAAIGAYYAKLRVTDDQGATAVYELPVRAVGSGSGGTSTVHTTTPTSGPAPLDVTFDCTGSTVDDGPILDYGFDFEGDGHIDAHGTNPVAHHTYPNATVAAPVIWITDGDGNCYFGLPLGPVTVTDPANLPPTAQLTVVPGSTTFPVTYTLDASASTDSDGTVTKYEWDFDGDGIFDQDSGTLSYITHKFVQIGSFTPKVRITDNDGATDTANGTPLTVATGWHTSGTGYVFNQTGLTSCLIEHYAGDHTRVMLAYGDGSASYVPLVLCSDEDSIGQFGLALPASSEVCNGPLTLASIGGLPALYYSRKGDPGTGGLSLVQANDVAGVSWVAPQNLDNTGHLAANVIGATTIDGRPAVATVDLYTNTVNYARSNDAGGAAWPALSVALSSPGVPVAGLGFVADVNGHPAIALNAYYGANQYYSQNYFNFANDDAGSNWNAPVAVVQGPDSPNYAGGNTTVGCALVDGHPAVVCDGPTGVLSYARSTTIYGNSWPADHIVLDKVPGLYARHNFITLLIVDGKPLVVCQRNGTDVIAIRATDADGTAWEEPEYIDSTGDVGDGCFAATDGSLVVVTYMDTTHLRSRVAYH